jgi:polyhydroxybutyrate depolymerase
VVRWAIAAALAIAAAGCSSGSSPTGSKGTGGGASGTTGTTTSASTSGATGGMGGAGGQPPIGGDRPVTVQVPSGAMPGVKMPLVILLHGYGVDGTVEELYFEIGTLANKHGFYFAAPSGTVDSMGNYYWNATDACCDFDMKGVDDSTYLSTVITEIEARYPIDPKRVYLVGHSNGGFMSYRMACDHGDQIAAIASLAGAMWDDVSKCPAMSTVSVAQIHGTNDTEVPYDGAPAMAPFPGAVPSAMTTVQDWVTIDGCSPTPDTSAPPLDFDGNIPGPETTITRWEQGCKPGGGVELWTMQMGTHIPGITDAGREAIIAFLYAHPKP